MRMRRAIGIGLCGAALLALSGCPKKTEDSKGDGGASATLAPSASASAADGGDASTSASKGASFRGKYTVSAGTMYVPAEKDWASVKFKNDESKLLGDGDISLAVDASGRVTGSSEGGPLGAAVVDGTSDGQTLSATVRRKDPTDDGLTGTLLATITGDKIDGTMKLAEFNAAVVRTATVTATRK